MPVTVNEIEDEVNPPGGGPHINLTALEDPDAPVKIKGGNDKCMFFAADVHDGLSTLYENRIEFAVHEGISDYSQFIGKPLNLEMKSPGDKVRKFLGHCISLEFLYEYQGYGFYHASVRPWLWFLTQRINSKVFYGNAKVVIDEVLSDNAYSANVEINLTNYGREREYCIQYNESDFDFISRLMEEEGWYYYWKHDGGVEKLVISDSKTGAGPVAALEGFENYKGKPAGIARFASDEMANAFFKDYVMEFAERGHARIGKVSLADFNMLTPKNPVKATKSPATPKWSHGKKDVEAYHYPGHYPDDGFGTNRALTRMERIERGNLVWTGAGYDRALEVGRTFKLENARSYVNKAKESYLITSATYYLRTQGALLPNTLLRDDSRQSLKYIDEASLFRVRFEASDSAIQYRPDAVTPWPDMPSMLTAIVVGDGKEADQEIYTDQYGRIKVQFHWDRLNKKDDKSSCWVRVATPWSGPNFGMIAIPRIGNEVLVTFEAGDPDRPIVTQMLYNADNMPPYKLPDKKTQSGIVSKSTKKGTRSQEGATSETFNELMFEDEKTKELVRFQAETDYKQIVKNNSDITIGMEKGEKGSKGNLTQTIKNDKTETLKQGNHTFLVEEGNETYTIKAGDQTIVVHKTKKQTIETGNYETEVTQGNQTTDIKTGNQTTTIDQGNQTTTVKLGNIKVDANAGKIEMTAAQEIKLTVGPSSISITPAGVTIKGPTLNIEGSIATTVKAPLTTVKADTAMTIQGLPVMIN